MKQLNNNQTTKRHCVCQCLVDIVVIALRLLTLK